MATLSDYFFQLMSGGVMSVKAAAAKFQAQATADPTSPQAVPDKGRSPSPFVGKKLDPSRLKAAISVFGAEPAPMGPNGRRPSISLPTKNLILPGSMDASKEAEKADAAPSPVSVSSRSAASDDLEKSDSEAASPLSQSAPSATNLVGKPVARRASMMERMRSPSSPGMVKVTGPVVVKKLDSPQMHVALSAFPSSAVSQGAGGKRPSVSLPAFEDPARAFKEAAELPASPPEARKGSTGERAALPSPPAMVISSPIMVKNPDSTRSIADKSSLSNGAAPKAQLTRRSSFSSLASAIFSVSDDRKPKGKGGPASPVPSDASLDSKESDKEAATTFSSEAVAQVRKTLTHRASVDDRAPAGGFGQVNIDDVETMEELVEEAYVLENATLPDKAWAYLSFARDQQKKAIEFERAKETDKARHAYKMVEEACKSGISTLQAHKVSGLEVSYIAFDTPEESVDLQFQRLNALIMGAVLGVEASSPAKPSAGTLAPAPAKRRNSIRDLFGLLGKA